MYNKIQEITLSHISTDRGKRWKWRKDIPDDALWPRCAFCGKFLKLEPLGLMSNNVINYIPKIEIFAVRRCRFCNTLDIRKYWWEDKIDLPKMWQQNDS